MKIPFDEISRCFQGIVPAAIATCSKDGVPNVTYLSQVFYLDPTHVALSCQFFNKTKQNVSENPYASVQLYDPLTFEAYELQLRFERAETSGPLFEEMSSRIEAIAAHVGMKGIFRLLSADVYEVLSFRSIEAFMEPATDLEPLSHGPEQMVTELRGLQVISERINAAHGLEDLLETALGTLDELFGFSHSMVLVPEKGDRLVTLFTHGYGPAGIGSEVAVGEGVIGTVARDKRCMHIAMNTELRYGRAVRERALAHDAGVIGPEIPLPGLPDAESELAIPLLVRDRLVGVLAIQSRDATAFHDWHEAYVRVIANLIAGAIDRASREENDGAPLPSKQTTTPVAPKATGRHHVFHFYKNDDAVFVDGEYLIRNVPGKILWKVLSQSQRDGRKEFSNRELRLDESLGLPPLKDNLESRLILLRKRLEQKCPDVRLVPVARGRFALELGATMELVEKESA